jgi:hypothetical protein
MFVLDMSLAFCFVTQIGFDLNYERFVSVISDNCCVIDFQKDIDFSLDVKRTSRFCFLVPFVSVSHMWGDSILRSRFFPCSTGTA